MKFAKQTTLHPAQMVLNVPVLMMLLFLFFQQASMAQKKQLPAADRQFMTEMIPTIREANASVAADRQEVHNIWVKYIKSNRSNE